MDLYSGYLISSFAQTTAAGLSLLLGNEFGPGRITRFLPGADYTSRGLWALPEPAVRAVEADDGVQAAEISSPIPMPIHISKMLIFAYDWIFFLHGQCCWIKPFVVSLSEHERLSYQ